MNKRIVTMGEIMLRLKAPGCERFFQNASLEAAFGGGEANVAVSLRCFGLPATFVTALPDNDIGEAAVRSLRAYGVQVNHIIRTGERIGIYYLEAGANQRASKVIYDREYSSFSQSSPSDYDFDAIFSDAAWFHVTGITPALSPSCASLAEEAIAEAKRKGLTVSVDLNFRKKLWNYGKSAPEIMRTIASSADVIIGNEEDCQKSLGIDAGEIDVNNAHLSHSQYEKIAEKVMAQLPDVKKVAITLRESHSASHNGWSAMLYDGERAVFSRKYDITDIVDRVGGGDSFAAGLIYGLQTMDDSPEALEFAVAASCLKHSVPGDFNLVSREEVAVLMRGDASGRVQR